MKFILLLLAAFVPYHESTLTVPFTFEIPNKVTSNRLVGQIKTVQAKKSQTFHIRHVVMSNENLPKENSNRNSVKSWETTALNKTKNDCDEETLKSYKGLRNMFCIDHKTGKIFTTKHITGASLNPGGGFSLEIIVQSGTSPGTIEERKWYTIHIVETCKYQLSRYKMVKECVNYKIPTKVKCYPKNNIDDVWVCPNITQSKPHYTIAHEVTIHRKITRTPIAFKYNEGPFRKIIRLIKSPHTERSIYTRSYTLINDTGFIYDDWTIFKNIFTDKFSIKQLIVSNQYDTCEKMDRCSDYINQIPNDITCSNFDINIFKEHTRRCKEKPKLQIKSANITIHLPHSSLKVIANTSYLETTKQLKLSIDSIDGPTLAGINITKPLQCNLNKSSNYFCIDENNGNIYTTIDWKNVPIRSVSYNIRVKAYDTTFPITSSVRTLRLTIKNNCSQDLSSVLRKNKCDAKLSKLISTKIMENKFMIFNSNVNPNAIFAAAISTKNIALNEGSQNVLTVMNHYKVNFTVNLKSPSVLLLPLQLSAHIPRKLSTAHNMNVTLKYFTPTGALRFHSLTKNSVKLLYTSSWSQCASDECFNIYNKWNGNQDPDDKINCQTPEDLYQEFYYKICTEIQPAFLFGPEISNETLKGCEYTSKLSFSKNAYWLINGTTRMNANITAVASATNRFKFSSWSLKNITRRVSYQCVVYDPLRMKHELRSEAVFFKKEIKAAFKRGPILNGSTMRGCEYTATMSLLSYTFWLINGTNKVNGTVEESTNKNLNNSFSFPKLIMDRFVPSTYYQCGIHYPDRMSKQLLSEKVYTDIDVRFVEGPKLVNTQLHGCSYNSSIPLNAYLYWLVNGTIKEKGTHSISSISTQSESNEYKFSQLDIINHSPGSFYQCVIFYPSRMAHMIVSERIYPDIQDINPIFINQPSLNGTILQGCDYKANISLHKYAYWLINGTKKVNGISVNKTSFSEVHDFPDLQILHYDATNFYQCVLYYPNRMKKIVKSLVITPDIRDINPTFITQPYLNGSILSGCSYKSDISLHEYTFWLINDSEVFQTTTSDPMSTTEKDLYNFPEYVIREFKPNTFYQCGVYYSKRMKGIELSDKIYTDIHPEFTNDPYLNGTKLQGCDYNADIPMQQYAYWLINGTIRMNGTSVHNSSFDISYRFPTLSILDYYPTTSYECILYHPHRMPKMIRSLKITPDIRNIKVTFVTQPRLNQNTLSGCSYNSNISMHDFTFWLINGSEVFQKTTSSPLSTAEKDLYNFPELVIRDFKPNTFYQCGVYNSKRMKGIELSKKIYTDIHPEFTNDPYLNGTKLQGCDYNADIPMQQYAYWLINGTIRMNGTSVHNSSSEISYRFPTLSILDYYPTTSYECILYHPHRMPKMIRSLKITPDIRNIKVIFVTQPRLNQNTLSGCSYNSNISMHDFTFWLINGSEVIQKTTSSPLSTAEKDLYNFPKYVIREFKPNTFYQCGVYNSKRMKGIELSKKIYTDIKPTFTQGPKWNGRALHNCKYQFKRTLQQYTFWLVNGTRRINASTIGTGKNENTGFEFPELYIEDFTPGITYQCGIYHPQRMTKPLLTDAFVPAFEDSNLIAGPKIFTKYPKTGGALILKGCIFYSKFPLANMKMFWMKNEKKVMANSTYIIKKNANYTYEIKSLIYNDTNHQQQGYYRCGLAVRGRPDVLSPKVDVQFVDVSESRLIFTVSGKWLKSYSDESSRQYKSLEKSLIKKISLLGNISTALQQKKFIQIMNLRRIVLQRDTIRVQARIIYAKVDETEQLQICMYMKSVLQREKYSTLHLISTRNYDCCLKHSVGDDHHKGMYHFNTTLVSNTVFIKCKYGERVINRTCIPDLYDGPKWSTLEFERCEKRPDTIEVLEKIAEQTICSSDNQNDCVTVQDTVEDLTNTVLKASMLKSPEEMDLVSHIISDLTTNIKVINTTQQAKEFIDKVLTCVDVVVTSPPHVVVASQNKWQTSTILLRNLDKMAVQLGNLITTTNDSISISKPNVGVNIAFVEAKDLTIELSNANGTVGVSFSSSNNQSNSNSQLIIPNETFKSKRELVYSFTYSSDMLFRRGQISSPQNNPTKIVNKKNRFKKSIDGHIVSASIGETKLANLTNPIILKFKKNDTQQGYQRNCHFWDFNINVQGEWSTEGCKYIKEDQSFVFCECDHLTNFALVLDVSQTFKNPLELKIITWIGCGISLAGLILTIITYISLKKLRAKLAPKLLICLCISLMLLLITFLIGAEQTQNRPICQSVAILLQFFTLTTFSWMAVEAYNLYRCFVRIFKSNTSDTQFLYKSSLVVWGLPALVVTATTAISPGNLGNDKVCVIYGAPFYFGLLLPVSLILLINFLTIYFVVTGINKASKTKSESKRKQQEKLHSTRVAFTCSVLLGLSWIFGVLAIGDLTEVFQWLFCIFNSLQGFFIFIFYTIKNKDAWHEWKKVFGLAPDNSFNSTLTRTKNGSKTGLYATTSNTSRIRADTLSTTLSRSPSSFVDDDEVAESSEELPGRISEHKL